MIFCADAATTAAYLPPAKEFLQYVQSEGARILDVEAVFNPSNVLNSKL